MKSALLFVCAVVGGAVMGEVSPQLGILTPPEGATPRINGPKVFGVRPGRPVLFKIPVTGVRPMELAVKGLSVGVAFASSNGVLSGVCSVAGGLSADGVRSECEGYGDGDAHVEGRFARALAAQKRRRGTIVRSAPFALRH